MIKRFMLLLMLMLIQPVFAGDLESALAKHNNVVLYMYTQHCGYCQRFKPIYTKVSKTYDKQFGFVDVDANTQYGYQLSRKFWVRYVPFVIVINSKTMNYKEIDTNCLMKTACFESELKKFKN